MKIFLSFLTALLPLLSLAQVTELQLLSHWQDTTLVASRAHDNIYNEVWGMKVDEREYAVIGSTLGTHILDVTNPENPIEVQRIPGAAMGTGIVHRDYHDYQCYLYAVCDEGRSTLQIIDISRLPNAAPIIYESDFLIKNSHNIFIDSSSAKLYSFATNGTTSGNGAMAIFDLSNPTEPIFLGNYNLFGKITAGHVHDGYVHRDTAYLNLGPSGFAVVDFSDPQSPYTIATLDPSEYPQSGYNHSCWRSDGGHHLYMGDEDWGHDLKVLDLMDYGDIDIPTTFNSGSNNAFSIPHNLVVACDYLYVSYYFDGLQVYDISDPAHPVRAFYYPTSQITPTTLYRGAWGVYPLLPSGNILVSDMQNGLFILEAIHSTCNTTLACGINTDTRDVDTQPLSFPNPVTNQFEVTLPIEARCTFFDLNGRVLEEKVLSAGSNKIDVSHLSSGLYLVKINQKSAKMIKL